MARSRVPAPYAVVQLALRIISISLSLGAFGAAAYTSAIFGYGRGMVGSFIASAWAITIDVPEMVGLLDKTRKARRCTEGFGIFLSFLTILICAILPTMILIDFDGLSHECGSRPVEQCLAEEKRRRDAGQTMLFALIFPAAVAGLHLIFMIMACVDFARRRKNHPPAQ